MCADHGLGSSISLEKGDDQQPAAIGFWLRASISIPSDLFASKWNGLYKN